MRKVIAAINMTIDGVFDHTAGIPDEELHRHYEELLSEGDAILYGRITYQLMEFWRTFLVNPSEEKSMNDFAIAIHKIQKIVFSTTLTNVDWDTAMLADNDLVKTVLNLKKESGKDIFIGSGSLIIQLLKHNLIDELQLCVHPVIAGNGLQLFEHINDRIELKLIKTKTFNGGQIVMYYEPNYANSKSE